MIKERKFVKKIFKNIFLKHPTLLMQPIYQVMKKQGSCVQKIFHEVQHFPVSHWLKKENDKT